MIDRSIHFTAIDESGSSSFFDDVQLNDERTKCMICVTAITFTNARKQHKCVRFAFHQSLSPLPFRKRALCANSLPVICCRVAIEFQRNSVPVGISVLWLGSNSLSLSLSLSLLLSFSRSRFLSLSLFRSLGSESLSRAQISWFLPLVKNSKRSKSRKYSQRQEKFYYRHTFTHGGPQPPAPLLCTALIGRYVASVETDRPTD